MNLAEFERRLAKVAPQDVAWRPFLCRGSPLTCDIFLVGINPGTDTPLWPYWSLERGCDKDAWLDAYVAKHGRLEPTRARIERICEVAGRDRVLETNVFHIPTAWETDLAKVDRSTTVFDFLVETLRPRVLFVHGGAAVGVCEERFGMKLPRGVFVSVVHKGVRFDVISGHHLAYQWSFRAVEELGRKLLARVEGLAGERGRSTRPRADATHRVFTNGEYDLYVWGQGDGRVATFVRAGIHPTATETATARPLQSVLPQMDLDEWDEITGREKEPTPSGIQPGNAGEG